MVLHDNCYITAKEQQARVIKAKAFSIITNFLIDRQTEIIFDLEGSDTWTLPYAHPSPHHLKLR